MMNSTSPPQKALKRRSSEDSQVTVRVARSLRLDDGVQTGPRSSSASEVVTLEFHDDSLSREDVLLNPDMLKQCSISPGDLVRIVALKINSDVRDFKQDAPSKASSIRDTDSSSKNQRPSSVREAILRESGIFSEPTFDVDERTNYVFIAKYLTEELKLKDPTLQISLHKNIVSSFGFRSRSQVVVSVPPRAFHTASHVELVFRDEYLARSDMWRLVIAELADKTVHKGQKVLFLGTVKALVRNIYIHRRKVTSAYFSQTTVPVFRSESARYVLFIQMSREMWDFDSEGSGEILFNRVINGFLPDLFQRWTELEVKHLVSIVLFGRLEYDQYLSVIPNGLREGLQDKGSDSIQEHFSTKDFYRVVVTDMASGQWTTILTELKKEFRIFLRDVSLHNTDSIFPSKTSPNSQTKTTIQGRPSTALRGNILEAINIASSQFASDYIDRDLVRTGVSIIVITPGSGVFEVDRDLLSLTSANLTNNGIGIDIVCLAKMPLHSVPLFKYRSWERHLDALIVPESKSENNSAPRVVSGSLSSRKTGISLSTSAANGSGARSSTRYSSLSSPENPDIFSYGIPQWIDLSYWSDTSEQQVSVDLKRTNREEYLDSRYAKPFFPRLRMYELQMMGLMELGLANISIPYLSEDRQRLRIKRGSTSRRWAPGSGSNRAGGKAGSRHYADHAVERRRQRTSEKLSTQTAGLLSVQAKQQTHVFNHMDKYDEEIFGVRTGRKGGRRSHVAGSSLPETTRQVDDPAKRALKSASTSIRESDSQHQVAMISKSIPREQANEKEHLPKPKAPSITPASRISRSISYALRGLAPPPRAVASTGVIVENAQAGPSIRASGQSHAVTKPYEENIAPYIADSQSINRKSFGSESAEPPTSTARSVENNPSRPIAIEAPVRKIASPSLKGPLQSDVPPTNTNTNVVPRGKAAKCDGEVLNDVVNLSDSGDDESDVDDSANVSGGLSPWIRNINPSNPSKNHPKAATWVGRWQHLYPHTPKTSGMKWKSLCTPASVPLTTDDVPTSSELQNDYTQVTHIVSQDDIGELSEIPKTRKLLVSEMIAIRLAHGYQIVVGEGLKGLESSLSSGQVDYLDREALANDGATIFMSMGNSIQKLNCINETEVQVTQFIRKPLAANETLDSIPYAPAIRTILSLRYTTRPMKLGGFFDEYPWKLADGYLAGRHEHNLSIAKDLHFWRTRFVLIPVDPPASAKKPIQSMSADNEEEIHLLGIRALTQMWQRHRYIPPEERQFKPTTGRRKDPNPLEINFQTLNPSEVVATEIDKLTLPDDLDESLPTQLLPESELLERETSTLTKLAQIMQSEKGIDITTRRWHLRLHFHCFKGDEFTTWLTLNFKDIDDRDDAVDFGNELMQNGLFKHVEGRHNFKDGNYFYQIGNEYRAARPELRSLWLPSSRRSDRSIPATPILESVPNDSPLGSRSRSGSNLVSQGEEVGSLEHVTSGGEKRRLAISLSKMMRLDIDPRKRSNRAEIVNLHYDRLHNPENCYHLELSWFNITSKLVEDAIVTWATIGEKYGLKLVELPIAEASSISDHEPFRTPFPLPLRVPPPKLATAPANGGTAFFTSTSFAPQLPPKTDEFLYQKALLKKFNFVLDLEAASDFPPDVDVSYSWGKLDYRYPQFVHRSGVILAQITPDGNFLLLANRLYNTRSASSKESSAKDPGLSTTLNSKSKEASRTSHPPPSGMLSLAIPHNPSSPALSPLVRASSDVLGGHAALTTAGLLSTHVTPEQVLWELEEFCADAEKLEAFYRDVDANAAAGQQRKRSGTGSGALRPARDAALGLEQSIPELVLPASLAGVGVGGFLGMRAARRVSPQTEVVGRESPRREAVG